MRKQQYVAAVACLVAGLIGFVGVYATDKGRERKEAKEQAVEETQKAPASYEVKSDTTVEDATKRAQEQAKKLAEQRARKLIKPPCSIYPNFIFFTTWWNLIS